jgi:hypothetical protein
MLSHRQTRNELGRCDKEQILELINREDFRRFIVRLDLGDPCEWICLQIVAFVPLMLPIGARR